ncbi:MAG: hypothetical protein KGM91_10030 [Burkholderiales bacterium]|nr:hypothetical protein [Burkholderiales bacterium]
MTGRTAAPARAGLADCCAAHARFQHEGLLRFEREVQLFVAYLEWVGSCGRRA